MISKLSTEAKLFFLLCVTGLLSYTILAFYTYHTAYLSISARTNQDRDEIQFESDVDTVESRFEKDLKYILMHTTNESWSRYKFLIEGQYHFLKQGCQHTNCYFTRKEGLLKGDIKNFDAIVINIRDIIKRRLPRVKTPRQKFIFHSRAPADHSLICREDVDNFFNWTWSYKLYSDILSPFFLVKDIKTKKVVAPYPEVDWSEGIKATYLKGKDILKFQSKTRAVAALVKNCNVKEGKIYAKKLRGALKRYSLSLDIFGCGMVCPPQGCDSVIASDYYFVLVQEAVLQDDYLTQRVLKAYMNNAVPIIKSGVDLAKFLPTGSYVDVRNSTTEQIAAVLHYIINNPAVYRSYFRWSRYYFFSPAPRFHGACDLCAFLNDQRRLTDYQAYGTFRKWWYNGPLTDDSCSNTTRNATERGLNESQVVRENGNGFFELVETMGPWSADMKRFMKALSSRLIDTSGDPRAGAYLSQRIGLAIQRGNAASVIGTMPRADLLEGVFFLIFE